MRRKNIIFFSFFFLMVLCVSAQESDSQYGYGEKEYYVLVETDYGNMTLKLYNQTPKHRDNFLKLVGEGFYDSLIFHRVIQHFMIQGGDPMSKHARPGQMLGEGSLGYRIPAEFVPGLFHKKGVLAAAREGDMVNPEKASSSCQFYIVQGNVWDDARLEMLQKRYGKDLTTEQIEAYKTVGGTPHLDGDYTVFGEVVDGLEVIDKIAAVPTDQMDRPRVDVRMKMTIVDRQ